jgi:hypothetical protein
MQNGHKKSMKLRSSGSELSSSSSPASNQNPLKIIPLDGTKASLVDGEMKNSRRDKKEQHGRVMLSGSPSG